MQLTRCATTYEVCGLAGSRPPETFIPNREHYNLNPKPQTPQRNQFVMSATPYEECGLLVLDRPTHENSGPNLRIVHNLRWEWQLQRCAQLTRSAARQIPERARASPDREAEDDESGARPLLIPFLLCVGCGTNLSILARNKQSIRLRQR